MTTAHQDLILQEFYSKRCQPARSRRRMNKRIGGNADMQPASIVILNWNGVHLLRQNMPGLIDAVAAAGGHHEIIMVDNGSTDGSIEFVRQSYPGVKILPLPVNMGLVRGYNLGSCFASHNIVVHLNNSVRVNRDFLRFMLPHFEHQQVFAVHPKLVALDGTIEAELSFASFAEKMIYPRQPHAFQPDAENYKVPCFSMYAPGGCSAYDRNKFWQMRGNDEIYSPFHWEESDLSYRAWKRGWEVIFEPRSIGHHNVHATIGKLDQLQSMHLYFRNWLIFNWINLTDHDMLAEHFAHLGKFVHQEAMRRRAFSQALPYMTNILSRRRWERPHLKLTDREVFAKLADYGRPVPNGAFVEYQGRVYRIECGRLRHVPGEAILAAYAATGSFLSINKTTFDQFPLGEPLEWPEGSSARDRAGVVYKIDYGRARAIDTVESAHMIGVDPGSLPVAHPLEIKVLASGKPLNLGFAAGMIEASPAHFEAIRKLLESESG